MTSAQDLRCSDTPPWPQPLGLWRARGASATALRLGMGLPPMHTEKSGRPDIDLQGYSLWHYWAESPRPCDLWSSVQGKLLHGQRDHRSTHGEHPWHRLALHGHLEAMKLWAKHFEVPFSENFDHVGLAGSDTLVMRAVWSGNDELVAWLLQTGADIHTPDEHGLTPLMLAIHRCSFLTVQALVHHGADPEAADERGRTSMHHAAQCDQADIYAMLEDCGGEPTQKDLHGQTPHSILARTLRTPQQAFITQTHWEMRYQAKLAF